MLPFQGQRLGGSKTPGKNDFYVSPPLSSDLRGVTGEGNCLPVSWRAIVKKLDRPYRLSDG